MRSGANETERLRVGQRLIERGVSDLAFTLAEVGILTKLTRSAIAEDVKSGALPARKRGVTTIVLAEDLVNYLAALPTVTEL